MFAKKQILWLLTQKEIEFLPVLAGACRHWGIWGMVPPMGLSQEEFPPWDFEKLKNRKDTPFSHMKMHNKYPNFQKFSFFWIFSAILFDFALLACLNHRSYGSNRRLSSFFYQSRRSFAWENTVFFLNLCGKQFSDNFDGLYRQKFSGGGAFAGLRSWARSWK